MLELVGRNVSKIKNRKSRFDPTQVAGDTFSDLTPQLMQVSPFLAARVAYEFLFS